MLSPGTFGESWALLDGVEGWLTEAQARRLHDAAVRVSPGGRIVEIGSFRGRSAIVLARAADPTVEVVAIDPHAGTDRGPREIVTTDEHGNSDHEVFLKNLENAGVRDRVHHVRAFSDAAHAEVDDPIDMLFIDGAHRYAPARADIHDWGARVVEGGTMLIHDSFNSLGVTAAQARELFVSDHWRYVGRSGSLAEYRRESVGRAGNAAKQTAQLGYFVQSVAIKVALTLKQPKIAKALGHKTDAPWPY